MPRDERTAWDIYFASVVAMHMHPGYELELGEPELEMLGELVDKMLAVRRKRFVSED